VKDMPIEFFRCEKCRREFDRREDAVKCEDGHLLPVAVEVKQYTTKPYPYSVIVTFSNGEKLVYNAEKLGG